MSSNPLDPNKQSADIGFISTRGGVIQNDTPFNVSAGSIGEYSAYVTVGTGGDILFQMEDGSVNPFFGVSSGSKIPVKANMVLSTATIDAGAGTTPETYTTSATGLAWHGGQ
jgi:hypothetical protein